MNFLLAALLTLQLLAVPPLTREQQLQLDTAQDFTTTYDEGATYPLLNNAMTWKDGDEAGATVPDYKAVLDKPADARGQLFLIEGYFFRSRPVSNLSRPGPWGDKLEVWSVSPDRKGDDQIEVLLVNGPPEKDLPRIRQNVRLVARFYKIWQGNDYTGAVRSYPIFVGNSARIIFPPGAGVPMTSAIPNPMLIAVVVLGVAVILVTAYRFFSSRQHPRRRVVVPDEDQPPEEPTEDIEENAEPLPKDPIAAMQELERRRKTKEGEAKNE